MENTAVVKAKGEVATNRCISCLSSNDDGRHSLNVIFVLFSVFEAT